MSKERERYNSPIIPYCHFEKIKPDSSDFLCMPNQQIFMANKFIKKLRIAFYIYIVYINFAQNGFIFITSRKQRKYQPLVNKHEIV
ncbi:hypothetical protein SAMN05216364_10093 [Porphyromonadaceae bacterium KHP3R9]|nr:hypothetical protein SAMN05216364_10093 [Porphyromonadaceae bacterium KHP3R9]